MSAARRALAALLVGSAVVAGLDGRRNHTLVAD